MYRQQENLGAYEKENTCCQELHANLKQKNSGAYEKGNTCCLELHNYVP